MGLQERGLRISGAAWLCFFISLFTVETCRSLGCSNMDEEQMLSQIKGNMFCDERARTERLCAASLCSYHRRARDWMMGMKGRMEWMDGKCTLTQTTEARGHRCPAPPDAEAGAPSAMTHHREG